MWDEELLYRAREEQLLINTRAKAKRVVGKEQLVAEAQEVVATIKRLHRLRSLPSILTRLEDVATKIKQYITETLEIYQIQNRDEKETEGIIENLRGAMYQTVAIINDKNISVNVTSNASQNTLRKITGVLKDISALLHDDTIELSVDMDCSRDEEIARNLAM